MLLRREIYRLHEKKHQSYSYEGGGAGGGARTHRGKEGERAGEGEGGTEEDTQSK